MSSTSEPNASPRRRFLVSGRVQGVGFRAWTVRRARSLDLRGTVRNRPDGTVEIEVEGEAGAVTRFRELLTRGPELAVVRSVREEPAGDDRLPAEFTIAW